MLPWLVRISATQNLKWFCDDCRDTFGKMQRTIDEFRKQMLSLSSDIRALATDRANPEKMKTRSSKKVPPKDTDTPSTPSSLQSNMQHSNLVVPEVIVGTCNNVSDAVKIVPIKKYIYASKFANTTSVEALRSFLCSQLNIAETEVDCRLLVPANQDVTQLNFVSFKIGVNLEIFPKLLQPEIWPVGVPVREFTDRPKNPKYLYPIVLQ